MNYTDDKTKRTWAEINLGAIRHNYENMRAQLPQGCRFLGVIKANGYGHGAIAVAQTLQNAGCDYLAVACFDEARELREAGITMPILILGRSPAYLARELAEMNVTQAVGDIALAEEMNRLLDGTGLKLKIHIKVETGMGRTGFRADDDAALEQLCRAVTMPNFVPEGIFTHFAVSDEFGDSFTQEQFSRFLRTVTAAESKSGVHFEIRHCTNSGAMVNYEEMYLDMVRPGVALYGCYPAQERGKLELIPAMELKTRIAVITEHRAGDTISYGRTYTAPHDMRVAVIQIGYADGLHRALSNKIEVLICGKRAKQIGRICMDMCMVDITDIPEAKEGDVAVIFGRDLPIEEQAEKAGTISYELLCGVSPRVPRVYID